MLPDDSSLPIKVPVAETTVAAYRFVFGRLGHFLELAWLPLLILLAVATLPGWLPDAWLPDGKHPVLRALPGIAELVVGAFCLNAFAVRWQQTALYGKQAPGKPFAAAWGRFMVYTLLLYIANGTAIAIVLLVAAPAADSSAAQVGLSLLALALTIPLWLATVRLSLLFPAAANGRPTGFAAAWRGLRGNTWRLILAGFFCCAPLLLAALMIMGAVFSAIDLQIGGDALDQPPMGLFLMRGLIDTLVNFLVVAMGGTLLVDFYRRLVLAQES